jgi:hypothetical protein
MMTLARQADGTEVKWRDVVTNLDIAYPPA